MTDLEQRYRQLMRAYPLEHRRHREEEMVGALLEVSAPGQRWPAAREAAAIVMNGWRTRAKTTTEWTEGLGLASTVATTTAAAVSVGLLGIAVVSAVEPSAVPGPHPWLPVAAWTVAVAGLMAICIAGGAASALAMASMLLLAALVGGAELVGVTRLMAASVACLAVLAAAGRAVQGTRTRTRIVALGTGALGGMALLAREGLGFWWSGPDIVGWQYIDRWVYVSSMGRVPVWLWLALVGVSVVAGAVRPRFAIAGALLSTPLLMLTGHRHAMSADHAGILRLAAALGVLAATASVRSRFAYRRTSETI